MDDMVVHIPSLPYQAEFFALELLDSNFVLLFEAKLIGLVLVVALLYFGIDIGELMLELSALTCEFLDFALILLDVLFVAVDCLCVASGMLHLTERCFHGAVALVFGHFLLLGVDTLLVLANFLVDGCDARHIHLPVASSILFFMLCKNTTAVGRVAKTGIARIPTQRDASYSRRARDQDTGVQSSEIVLRKSV